MSSLENYLSTFTEHQSFVQSIAIQMLGSSYNLAKSNGFRSWLSKQETQVGNQPATLTEAPKEPEPKSTLKVKKGKNPKPKPIYKKLLDFLQANFDEGAVCLEGVAHFGLSCIPTNGGVYWITNEKDVLFLGTTSDLRKNVILAIKSIKKKCSDDNLKEAITQLIDNKSSVGAATLCVIYLETDDAKKRIRIKNKAKGEASFTPVLE